MALVFFQCALLLGYLYAHLLGRLSLKKQGFIHGTLLLLSLIFLPIIPDLAHVPEWPQPGFRILFLLSATIGLPYLLLASTSPLMQHWLAKTEQTESKTYRLYALSNAASLLGLGMYPFILEPLFGLRAQAWIWSIFFLLFAASSGYCAWKLRKEKDDQLQHEAGSAPLSPLRKSVWFFLPAIGVVLLLSVTNQLTIDIAPTPFLWVLPLSVYLISFILSFGQSRWYERRWYFPLFLISVMSILWLLLQRPHLPTHQTILIFITLLFAGTMICHGELARQKPATEYLTEFYLLLSAGGAGGGLFVGLLAPILFNGYWEFPLSIGILVVMVCTIAFSHSRSPLHYRRSLLRTVAFAHFGVIMLAGFFFYARDFGSDAVFMDRNFYGILRVRDRAQDDPEFAFRELLNGTTLHGSQLLAQDKRGLATTYYGETSGLELAFLSRRTETPLRAGVIGLGAGTTAAYGRPQDHFRFYEIDPDVEDAAREYFTFLSDFPGQAEVITGDARLSLEEEENQEFDVLAIDAFSSDAIPFHLLTKEAFDIYLRHLKQDGIIAVHISNRYLRLEPVVLALRDAFNLEARIVESADRVPNYVSSSTWILLSPEPMVFADALFADTQQEDESGIAPILWTDDKNSLFDIVKLSF